MSVTIKAQSVLNNGDGTFAVVLEGRELTKELRQALTELYPNLLDQAYKLLDKEAILEAITEDAERPQGMRSIEPNPEHTETAGEVLHEPWRNKPKPKRNDPPATEKPY